MDMSDSTLPRNSSPGRPTDFIREAVAEDLKNRRFSYVRTRLPPEPNGYLHIGHAKAFLIDYLVSKEFGGELNLRFDDTNPAKEETEYVEAIKEDARWLGIEWGEREFYASDYFDKLYEWAIILVKKGKAYVDDQSSEEVSASRGTLRKVKWQNTDATIRPGKESPFRNRSVEENLDLLNRMKNGEFPDGTRVLRAKIDMAHPNLNMRDPIMYRIIHEPPHHRTARNWCIYPMYDWSHGQNDSMEGITHSLCDKDYESHRPLYEWFLDELGVFKPRQIEFARLKMNYTMMSKRKLRRLVEMGIVNGWDDPRLTTLRGLRRRGVNPESILDFISKIGVAKNDSWVELALLESCIRDDLNKRAPRRMAALRPLKLVLDNYPDGQIEEMDAVNNPEDGTAGTRKVPFSKVLFIEQGDFQETPPPKYFRLYPGNEVRLRYAYLVKCTGIVRDMKTGDVSEVHCTYDPTSRGGDAPDGRKIKSTIHWVSAQHAVKAEVRLYNRLFTVENPDEGEDINQVINPNSLEVLSDCRIEPNLAGVIPGDKFQFERNGYFCVDLDSKPGKLVFNRTVTLKDTWAKIEQKRS